MKSGRPVSDDLAAAIVRMSVGFNKGDISMWTRVGVRTIEKILACFRRTGFTSEAERKKALKIASTKSKRYHMSDEEVAVCSFSHHVTQHADVRRHCM